MHDVSYGSNSEVELADADFRFTPESRHPAVGLGCPFRAIRGSRAHSITSSPRASTLAGMVTRAARLFAILLRIARGLRHADKGPPRFLRVETRSAGFSCRSRATALCACSGRPAMALLAAVIRNPGR